MKTARQLCIAILIVTAIAALYGGYALIIDPDGRSMRLMIEDLKGTPFADYSVPGWLLLILIGVGSFVAAVVAQKHQKFYPYLVMAEGFLLLLFIVIHVILQGELHFVPIVFGLFAIALLLLGNLIRKYLQQKPQHIPQAVAAEHHAKKSHYHKNRKRGH